MLVCAAGSVAEPELGVGVAAIKLPSGARAGITNYGSGSAALFAIEIVLCWGYGCNMLNPCKKLR